MDAEAVREVAHALDRLLAALAHHVGCAELPCECNPVRMAAEDDDLLGAETLRGDHAAQTDGAVADDRGGLTGADVAGDGRVVARAHHVREREQRRHQRVVFVDRQDDECSVRLRNAHRFGLCSRDVIRAEEASVDARRLQPLMAEHARAVRERERHDHEIARLQGPHVGADVLDHADRLVSHVAAGIAALHRLVRPQIATADAGVGDPDECVGRLDEARVGHVLDANVARGVHHCRAHCLLR